MPSSITLKAIGLNLQPNQLDPQSVPPGSLNVASNVIIRRDNVLESRRGYKLYAESLGTSSDRAKQLMTYKGRILRHFSNQLEYDTLINDINGNSIFDAFCGTFLEAQTGRRIRFIEANGNFYFTTSYGIKKISALTAADFTTSCSPQFVTQAGGIKALDVSARLNTFLGNESGFLPQDSAVSYRIVWGMIDANKNEILGTPSQSVSIFNPLINLELNDFNNLLVQLDNVSDAIPASLISDGNYFTSLNLPINASAGNLLTNLTGLAVKLDEDIFYANDTGVGAPLQIASANVVSGVATITFSVGNPQNYFLSGSHIYLTNFLPTSGIINGPQVVATVTPTTITFNTVAGTGAVTVTGAEINSYKYETLVAPSAPSFPPTDQELVNIQAYMQSIISRLQSEPDTGTPPTITTASQAAFITPIQLTTTANVTLTFTIPQGVTTDTFYQIYRSDIVSATGASSIQDIVPNDELRLVFEGFPTAQDLINGFIQVTDITPQSFAGAFLYTNATTGQGILQSNDTPPFALDINRFKNVLFYANTRTKFQQLISLLGITNMITDYNNGITPTITITNGTVTNTYTFVTGVQQVVNIATVADVAGNLAGKYFTINDANNVISYYVWFSVSGVGTDPLVSGKVGIEVVLDTSDSANTVAQKVADTLALFSSDFTTTTSTNNVIVTNINQGPAANPTAGTSGFTTIVLTSGRGEDAAAHQILLSTNPSPAIAVDQTARSLVHVININSNESVYAFYLSGTSSVPGQIELESRTLNNIPFYVLANDSNTGSSFNPDISPTGTISSISMATQSIITTSTPHGLINQDKVVITNSNSTPSVDGLYTITYISATQFSIPVNVTVAGNRGSFKAAVNTLTATNNARSNRVYFSKLLQPEAVPATNFYDVGAQDKAILRIFPLRDSLFVYKEDGLFRISGESAPFNLSLFDSSCVLIAPDSVDVSNNLIYGWTTQGITATSEAGVNIISRPIDIDILKLATSQYTNFKSATWGIGYESDNSYTVYTIQQLNDVYATIGYRYSTLTNTWTTFDKTNTCGIINSVDDLQYLGSGDVNFLEQERKNFNRLDYSDRQFIDQLQFNNYYGNQIQLSDISNLAVGDVITQDQQMTSYIFNQLLSKLDTDVLLSPHTYVLNNTMVAGADPRIQLDNLITQIANDPGRVSQSLFTPTATYLAYEAIVTTSTITNIAAGNPTVITTSAPHGLQNGRIILINGSNSTPSIDGSYTVTILTNNTFTIPVSVKQAGTTGSINVQNSNFSDILASYNGIINLLNNDQGTSFHNYSSIVNDTLQEAIIIGITPLNKRITLNLTLDFMVGPLTVFKAINTNIQWAPVTFGNPMTLKHVREFSLMFENKAFTLATMSFSSDLLPAFQNIPFIGTSNGIFGFIGQPAIFDSSSGKVGFGYSFFGGGSHSAPFRTYIPRDVQRCRYINCLFNHNVAREQYAIFGLTLTPNDGAESTRGYR
jgi:hypothetical protein